MIVIEFGPWGTKWRDRKGNLNPHDNKVGFTCGFCGHASYGFQKVSHLEGCKHPHIGDDIENN